jgi:hypothetical protein
LNALGEPAALLSYGEPVRIRLGIQSSESHSDVQFGCGIYCQGVCLTTYLSSSFQFDASPELQYLECEIPGGVLLPGLFEIHVSAFRVAVSIDLDWVAAAGTFRVSEVNHVDSPPYDRRKRGLVSLPAEWRRVSQDCR